jgi:hypothetical protein
MTRHPPPRPLASGRCSLPGAKLGVFLTRAKTYGPDDDPLQRVHLGEASADMLSGKSAGFLAFAGSGPPSQWVAWQTTLHDAEYGVPRADAGDEDSVWDGRGGWPQGGARWWTARCDKEGWWPLPFAAVPGGPLLTPAVLAGKLTPSKKINVDRRLYHR